MTYKGWYAMNPKQTVNVNSISVEEQWWFYLTRSWEDKGVITFPKGIRLNVNVIVCWDWIC